MKVYEKKIVPAIPETERMVLTQIECDLCGERTDKLWANRFAEGGEQTMEITVKMKKGSSTPFGGGGVMKEYDICSKCMESVVMGLLDDLITKRGGTVPAWTEWDW